VPEGVELVERARPDLLFLDVELGDRTGFDLLEVIGPERPHVIFTTAYEGMP
jgi:two-component system LytT family response regulator